MAYKSKEERRQAYLNNREHYLEQNKLRYQNNKEKLLEYQKEYREKNYESILEKVRAKRQSRLNWAIKYLGSKCSRCNIEYDSCQYDFHHLNPEDKDFTIGENVLVSKAKFEKEISKCILLCANCHRLTHKEIILASRKI